MQNHKSAHQQENSTTRDDEDESGDNNDKLLMRGIPVTVVQLTLVLPAATHRSETTSGKERARRDAARSNNSSQTCREPPVSATAPSAVLHTAFSRSAIILQAALTAGLRRLGQWQQAQRKRTDKAADSSCAFQVAAEAPREAVPLSVSIAPQTPDCAPRSRSLGDYGPPLGAPVVRLSGATCTAVSSHSGGPSRRLQTLRVPTGSRLLCCRRSWPGSDDAL